MLTPLNRISVYGSAGKHAFGFVEYRAGRDWARQWTWFKTLCKMTFRRSSRIELMEFYPERAGAITNVKLFGLDAGLALGGVFHRL